MASRRAPSPLPRYPQARPYADADEKKAQAYAGGTGTTPASALVSRQSSVGLRLSGAEFKVLIIVVFVALGVRLFRLSQPNSVVFDEVHFGKFASKYIKTQYYVDVHPPLAKLLITLVAYVSGFDGVFDFKDIAKVYENTPYTSMRLLPAILGVAVVPFSYLTLRGLDCGVTTALLGATFVTLENGLITQSRLILLDSPLLFFTALTTFCWVTFSNVDRERGHEFKEKWWLWLILSGLSLGAVVSCKWVGLFTIATVGVDTIRQLWVLLGDLRVSPRLWAKHFLARALCLIVLPIFFYMAMFAIHFQILQSSGDGDGFMSSAFQHTLSGKGMSDTYAGEKYDEPLKNEGSSWIALDVAFGSEVAIRHLNTQGGYLHSHDHPYPAGSRQQQITLYPHNDQNNLWRILNATDEGAPDPNYHVDPITHIKSGMIVRFEHISTNKRLHSHDVRPPVSDVEFQNEVSGYGFPGFSGDANDNWAVEIEEGDKHDRHAAKRMRTLHTIFRLRHTLTGCYLFSHKVKLPEWGFEQQEVTCNKNAVKPNSLWYIETNSHPQLGPGDEKTNYRLPGFFSKFWELQQVMWRTNAGLTDRHSFDSRPHTWPLLRRGINFWVKDHRQIYLLGNPFIWWFSTASVVAYALVRGILILREKRGYQDFTHSRVVKYDRMCTFLAIGWALHYFPFFLMERQLFLHHYFPALYFAILLSCAAFDLVTSSLRPRVRLQIAAVLAIVALYNFVHFSPLAYGNVWTRTQCINSKWIKSWDFSCNDFYEEYSQYHGVTISATPTVAKATIGGEPGGRAPIVVNDPAAQLAVEDSVQAQHTTEGLPNVIAPGPDIFEQPVVKDIKSDDATRAVGPIEGPSSAATGATVVESDIPPPLPKEPEDLVTTAEAGGAGDAITTDVEKVNLVPDVEEGSTNVSPSPEAPEQTASPSASVATTSQPTAESLSDAPQEANDNVNPELERVQQELFE